jgi:hypothetical protein
MPRSFPDKLFGLLWEPPALLPHNFGNTIDKPTSLRSGKQLNKLAMSSSSASQNHSVSLLIRSKSSLLISPLA